MGTRSTTVLMDDQNRPIVTMYRQYDGYPSGHGKDLVSFLKEAVYVNGFSSRYDSDKTQINGMADCAVQIITLLKNQTSGQGNIYLHNPQFIEKQGYHYTVYLKKIDDAAGDTWQNPEAYRIAVKCESDYFEQNNGVIFDDLAENLDENNLEPVEENED